MAVEASAGITYTASGVDYDALDPFKRMAQLLAHQTAANILDLGFSEVEMSRGESVYLVETPFGYLAHVEEGLGSKNLVADAMYNLTGQLFFNQIAQCCVAMIVNDMITLGARPISVAMHLAVESGDWFKDTDRINDLLRGWKHACDLAMCTWGGGETPALKNIVVPSTAMLSGSAMGFMPKERLVCPHIQDGDMIVIIESSGVHANGLTLMREIAGSLEKGYLTLLPNGRSYGEALLDPTHIYVPAIESCLNAGIDIHYTVNITGHGWRKFMRAVDPFTYIIEILPTPLPIFDFIQKHGPVSDEEAYGNLNMGAGFALFVSASDVQQTIDLICGCGEKQFRAYQGGYIKKTPDKKVIIEPKDITFSGKTLNVR